MKVLAFLTRFRHHRPDGGYKQLIAEVTRQHAVEYIEWGNDETQASFPNGPMERLQASYKWLAEWRAYAATRGKGIDLVHIMYAEEYYRFSHRLFSHVPLIATFHQPADLLEQELVKGGHGGRVAKWTHQWNRNRFSHLAGAIVTHPDQKLALSRVMQSERIHVIPLGVSLPEMTWDDSQAPRMGVLTLGNWFRDWEMYEQVVARMPEETFHLVNRQLPLEVAERLMQFPNVHYHRNLSDAELNSLLTGCSLAFLPLLKLAGSNALLECLSAGLPVVVSDVNAVEDGSLPKQCVARFQATRPDDAVRHLRAFKTSVSVADRMGCVEIARTFSWPSVAERTYELYQSSL